MTQPIDPTMWPKVEGSAPERGVYFVVHKTGGVCAMPYQKGETHSQSVTLYGPITFATDKTMPQVIDLSHFDLSKIEPKKAPNRPGVWHLSKSTNGFPDTNIFVSQELIDHPSDWDDGEYRFLCDFIPPTAEKPLPPVPTKEIYLIRIGAREEWCIKAQSCDFYMLENGLYFANADSKPRATKTLTA